MSSRAVILPTPGDPFLLYYWMQHYESVWRDEVDKLYVCINGQTDKESINFIYDLLTATTNCEFIDSLRMIDHGNAIDELLGICKEKHIMLIEDDAFVFRKGKVKQCFELLESGQYQVVGSKRGSCSQEILDKAAIKWSLSYEGLGDQGCNFWPNFFFSSRALLLKTDRNFCAKLWKPGQVIDGLNEPAEADCAGDTFVNTSLQIHSIVPESQIWYEPQHHGATDDQPDYDARTNIWAPQTAWLHVGSLSSGIFGLLDLNKPLPQVGFNTEQEKLELERRVTFWSIFAENFKEPALKNQLTDYKLALDRLCNHYELNRSAIAKRMLMYYEVLPRWTMT
jgi:hypothetical protein